MTVNRSFPTCLQADSTINVIIHLIRPDGKVFLLREKIHPVDLFSYEDFLFGLISVVIINLTSLFGAIILPFRKKSTFKWILTIFIGLGSFLFSSPSVFSSFLFKRLEHFWEQEFFISFRWSVLLYCCLSLFLAL